MTRPIVFDPKLGVIVTPEMDAEIDRLLPEVLEVYPIVQQDKLTVSVGEFKFMNPYTGLSPFVPLLIECKEKSDTWGWTRFHMVGLNAIRDLKDYEYRRVVAHELIHVIDPVRIVDYQEPKDNWEKYLTQECEFNAYSGMIAYSIRKNAKTWRGTKNHDEWVKGLGETFDVVKDPADYIEQHKKAGVFDAWYAAILLEYQKYLPQDRFELFIGRIQLAIDDGLAHLRGETLTPFMAV